VDKYVVKKEALIVHILAQVFAIQVNVNLVIMRDLWSLVNAANQKD
jgi:hypothetical protein